MQEWWQERPASGLGDSIVFLGDRFATYDGLGKETLAGTFAIVDAVGAPKQMDLICTKGRYGGKRLRAIYKIDGDRLEISADDGTDRRPKIFFENTAFHFIGKRKDS